MKIICDWENCNETGSYKAPIEKDNSKKYRLLCLNHIKIFKDKIEGCRNLKSSKNCCPNFALQFLAPILSILSTPLCPVPPSPF